MEDHYDIKDKDEGFIDFRTFYETKEIVDDKIVIIDNDEEVKLDLPRCDECGSLPSDNPNDYEVSLLCRDYDYTVHYPGWEYINRDYKLCSKCQENLLDIAERRLFDLLKSKLEGVENRICKKKDDISRIQSEISNLVDYKNELYEVLDKYKGCDDLGEEELKQLIDYAFSDNLLEDEFKREYFDYFGLRGDEDDS